MTSERRATRRPFTVVCCEPCQGDSGLSVSNALRESIRRCEHGVLMVSACLLGQFTCASKRHGSGVMVVVQPCAVDRRPNAPARWIGPIKDQDDVGVLRDWLELGDWDPDRLPDRLRTELASAAVSQRN